MVLVVLEHHASTMVSQNKVGFLNVLHHDNVAASKKEHGAAAVIIN